MPTPSAMRTAPSSSSSLQHSSRAHNHTSSPSNSGTVGPSATTTFTPSSSMNDDEVILPTTITLDQALSTHAKADNPARAALEATLADRNNLSFQNAQLWKHLRRQRTNYAQAMKDVGRLRGERDSLKEKLQRLEKSVGVQPLNGRPHDLSSSTSRTATAVHRDTSESYASTPTTSDSDPRSRMVRHQSDETPGSCLFVRSYCCVSILMSASFL